MTDKVPPVHRHRTGKRLGELQQLRERFRAPLPSWERGHAQRPAGPQPGMLANLAAAGLTSEWTDRFHRLSLLATATVESLIPLPCRDRPRATTRDSEPLPSRLESRGRKPSRALARVSRKREP